MQENKGNNLVIIDVFPISRGIHIDSLSFFTSEKVSVGNVVDVPIRSKTKLAIVWRVRHIKDAKSELKNATFSLKKATNINPRALVLPDFIEATKEIAQYFLSTPGAVLFSLVPTVLFSESEGLKLDTKRKSNVLQPEQFVLQTDEKERFAHYKGIIREEFAKGNSVFFCVPTSENGRFALKELCKGIETYTHTLDNSKSKKNLIDTWNAVLNEKHSVLIIGTPQYMVIPRNDIRTIIVEKESSRSYKSNNRPFLDIRTTSSIIARHMGARIIFGDTLLRIETIWKQKQGEYIELLPLKFRTLSTAKEKILQSIKKVDSNKQETDEDVKKEFSTLLPESKDIVSQTKSASERTLILCTRKGIAPTTICQDCETTVSCASCNSPVTLHKSARNSFFLCHRCGERRDPDITCSVCGGWRLVMLGIGTEKIEEEIKNDNPELKVFRLDKESAKTPKQATKIIESFYASPGSVLVGTEIALNYIHEPIENIIIASIDSLFALPDFRIHERILHFLLNVRSKASSKILIQTRNSDMKVFEYGISGSMLDFYKENISERKEYFYPPFSTLIKISLTGDRKAIVKEMQHVQEILGEEIVDVFPAFVAQKNKKTSMFALVRIKNSTWPQNDIVKKLQELPPSVEINVEPESII